MQQPDPPETGTRPCVVCPLIMGYLSLSKKQDRAYAEILKVFAKSGLNLSEMHEVLWTFVDDIENPKRAEKIVKLMSDYLDQNGKS